MTKMQNIDKSASKNLFQINKQMEKQYMKHSKRIPNKSYKLVKRKEILKLKIKTIRITDDDIKKRLSRYFKCFFFLV